MHSRSRMIVGTVAYAVSLVGVVLGLTLLFNSQLRLDEQPEQNIQRSERHVRAIQEYGSDIPKDEILEAQITSPPFVSVDKSYTKASVTTDTAICSRIGIGIQRDSNGSVVDAAIATSLCVGLVNAHSCGIGGGHFATIYERPKGKSEKVMVALIARTRAPGFATQDMFVNKTLASSLGGWAIGIPGEVSGYYEAWKMFGRLPWSDLFQPAIRLCEDGFTVEPPLAKAINSSASYILNDTNLRELFVKADGSLVKDGDLLKNPKLGATLRSIAADPFAFYNGSLAEDIVKDLSEYGSNITVNDLRNYRSQIKATVNVTLDNGRYRIFNPPPPSSGSVLDFIVNILDGYNFSQASLANTPTTVLTYHRIIEAFKFAYAKRSALGDEDFVNVTQLVANLTSDSYAEQIRSQIDDNVTHDVSYYGPNFEIRQNAGTAHMNILSSDGAALALTSSINLYFGAKVRGRRTGIIFNNDMDDFSTPGTVNSFGIPASPSNYIVPGKIPMSSMCPSLVLNERGDVVYASGASGGTLITTSTAFVFSNSLWFDVGIGDATDTGRVHHQLVPNQVSVEYWIDPAIIAGLRMKNHSVVASTDFAVVGSIRSRCQATGQSVDACIEAVSDGRKWGSPDGYELGGGGSPSSTVPPVTQTSASDRIFSVKRLSSISALSILTSLLFA